MYSIARQFNTTISELMELNNLQTTTLSIGQQLKLPSNGDEEIVTNEYIVKSGDKIFMGNNE